MKKFLYSFLGTMAGLWLSFFLGFILLILMVAVAAKNENVELIVKENSVLHINLNGPLVDREQEADIWGKIYGTSIDELPLDKLILAIRKAAVDDRINGIYLECNGGGGGMAQLQRLSNELENFRNESGKWILAYSDNYTQGNYYVASYADSLFVNPVGMVDLHGLSATTMYFKTLLDKIGVEAQVVKVGTYKSAVEPFMLSEGSEANREQQRHFLGKMWNVISGSIASNRSVSVDSVNNWADSYLATLDASYYLKNKVVDGLKYRSEMDSVICKLTETESPNKIDAIKYSQENIKLPGAGNRAKIAVLYAIGDITESGKEGIASDRLVPDILDIADDDDIDGLIMYVNSGGGSAFASEQIWEALQQFKAKTKKPFYVSMGDYAASGGYYISCGADKIYAQELTLTGSIGIFGIIPNANKLLSEKLGVNSETVSTNTGELPGFIKPMSEGQRNAMQAYVNRGYELFVKRCADGRNMPVDSIKAIAEGRVWDGISANERGLVDKLGMLSDAILDMAESLDAIDSYDVVVYPDVNAKWWESFSELAQQAKVSGIKSELGDSYIYYDYIKNVMGMDNLQCRMDYITIK